MVVTLNLNVIFRVHLFQCLLVGVWIFLWVHSYVREETHMWVRLYAFEETNTLVCSYVFGETHIWECLYIFGDVCLYVCKIYLTSVKNVIITKSSTYNTNLNRPADTYLNETHIWMQSHVLGETHMCVQSYVLRVTHMRVPSYVS